MNFSLFKKILPESTAITMLPASKIAGAPEEKTSREFQNFMDSSLPEMAEGEKQQASSDGVENFHPLSPKEGIDSKKPLQIQEKNFAPASDTSLLGPHEGHRESEMITTTYAHDEAPARPEMIPHQHSPLIPTKNARPKLRSSDPSSLTPPTPESKEPAFAYALESVKEPAAPHASPNVAQDPPQKPKEKVTVVSSRVEQRASVREKGTGRTLDSGQFKRTTTDPESDAGINTRVDMDIEASGELKPANKNIFDLVAKVWMDRKDIDPDRAKRPEKDSSRGVQELDKGENLAPPPLAVDKVETSKVENSPSDIKQAPISEVVNAVASRILVGSTGLSRGQEVRVTFQEDVLPKTEARISHTPQGIKVEFVVRSDEAFKWLQNNLGSLQQVMSKDRPTSISVVRIGGDHEKIPVVEAHFPEELKVTPTSTVSAPDRAPMKATESSSELLHVQGEDKIEAPVRVEIAEGERPKKVESRENISTQGVSSDKKNTEEESSNRERRSRGMFFFEEGRKK